MSMSINTYNNFSPGIMRPPETNFSENSDKYPELTKKPEPIKEIMPPDPFGLVGTNIDISI